MGRLAVITVLAWLAGWVDCGLALGQRVTVPNLITGRVNEQLVLPVDAEPVVLGLDLGFEGGKGIKFNGFELAQRAVGRCLIVNKIDDEPSAIRISIACVDRIDQGIVGFLRLTAISSRGVRVWRTWCVLNDLNCLPAGPIQLLIK